MGTIILPALDIGAMVIGGMAANLLPKIFGGGAKTSMAPGEAVEVKAKLAELATVTKNLLAAIEKAKATL
jgi:hypothetical protein